MSRLTQDMTDETVSRDQILRHARGQGNIHFPCSADHEQDWQPCQVDPYRVTLPAVMRRTFLISVPNRGLENRKKENTSACSSRPCLKKEQVDWDNCPCFKQGTLRRLDSGGSWYKLDSGWDSGRHRNRNPNHNKHLCDSTSNVPTNIKTVHLTSLLEIESRLDRLGNKQLKVPSMWCCPTTVIMI